MTEDTATMGATIATTINSDTTNPSVANSVDQPPTTEKHTETTPSNSATSTAVSTFWSGKPSKPSSTNKEKQKSVVNLVIGDSDELTDQSDENEDHVDEEERSEVSKDLKEEDDESEYKEILRRKTLCQNCERDGRPNCVLAPRIGRYPRCIRCRDKDWRCSFLPMKNGEYAPSVRKPAHHKSNTRIPIDVDIKPVIPKDPPSRPLRGPGRPTRPPTSSHANTSKSHTSTASTSRAAPYDRNLRLHHHPPQPRNNLMAATASLSNSFRVPSSSSRTAQQSNSSPLANRSASASNLLRRAAHNALAAEEGTGVNDTGGNNSQLLDALSKMSRALRLSSEAFQLLADYQRGKPPSNASQDDRGTQGAPMVLE